MGAMLLARSATASTDWRNARCRRRVNNDPGVAWPPGGQKLPGAVDTSNEPQPEPLILGLAPDQPAPGAAIDREHKAIYCRQQAAELSQPDCLKSLGQGSRAGGPMSQGTAVNVSEPATLPDLFSGPPPVTSAGVMAAPRSPWRGPVRCGHARPAHLHT
jgi:hypothetical protein